MSLLGALSSATAGLRVVQANLKVVTDNVTHANDADRTRHTLSQTFDNSGIVSISAYSRTTDAALYAQVNDLAARDSRYSTQQSYMTKMGDLLQTTDGTAQLSKLCDKFTAAWKTLQATPEDQVAQYQVVSTANDFAREMNRVSQGVEDLDSQMNNDIQDSVSKANDLLTQIGTINNDIVSLQGQGDAATTIRDKRDGLISQLNDLVGCKTIERPDGRVAVFTASGLSLLDAQPAKLSYAGGNINLVIGNVSRDVSGQFSTGKLGALVDMRRDGSTATPPTAPSSDPSGEILRKMRSQLNALADAFTSTTKPGEPTSFADAYDNATPAKSGELSGRFFVGSDRFTFAVNADLLSNAAKVKSSAVPSVVTAVNATGRTITADGLKATDVTYGKMVSTITGNVSSIASSIKAQATDAKTSHDLLADRYSSATGVNIDQEIALLQQLQTSYSASARIVQVTTTMYDALEAVVK